MIWLFYILASIVFASLIADLIRHEKSEYYKSIHLVSHSDEMKNKYIPDPETRDRIDNILKEADDSYKKAQE